MNPYLGPCMVEHVEGSTQCQGMSILRTKFTEVYPRKFARLAAKVICHSAHEWPFDWKTGSLLTQHVLNRPDHWGETSILAAQHRRTAFPAVKRRDRASFARSQLSVPEETDETGVKRRRLDGKQAQIPRMQDCQAVFQELQSIYCHE